jgi:hypothetical protein
VSTLRANTVSRYLGQQGFQRSHKTRGRICDGWTEGYTVRTNAWDKIVVEWRVTSNFRHGDADNTAIRTDAMEKVLSVRYTVTRDKDTNLVVAAKETAQPVQAPVSEVKAHTPKDDKVLSLGRVQEGVLEELVRHGGQWYPGCGWTWSNVSTTKRVLASLAARGLAEKVKGYGPSRVAYRITEEGRKLVAPKLPRPPDADLRITLVMLAEQNGEWTPDGGWHYRNVHYTKLCLDNLVADGYVALMGDNHYGLKGGIGFDKAREWGWDDTLIEDGEY